MPLYKFKVWANSTDEALIKLIEALSAFVENGELYVEIETDLFN